MVQSPSANAVRRRVARGRRALFERLAVRALDQLPAEIHAMLDNVEIVIEDEPTAEQLGERPGGRPSNDALLGLYEGTPLTERSGSDGFRLPDRITLFRLPLERSTTSQSDLADQVRVTVVHELAHHVGLDEDRIADLGWA